MTNIPKILNDIADKVLRYKPAPKSDAAKARAKKSKRVKRKAQAR